MWVQPAGSRAAYVRRPVHRCRCYWTWVIVGGAPAHEIRDTSACEAHGLPGRMRGPGGSGPPTVR